MKRKFTYSVQIYVDIIAETEEEAQEKFNEMSYDDMAIDGIVTEELDNVVDL